MVEISTFSLEISDTTRILVFPDSTTMESQKELDADAVEYWKKQAAYYERKAFDIQQELDEYTENSAQLEKELEASLVQVEKQNRDLEHQNQRLKNEIEMLRSKLERSQNETNALENELQKLKEEKDKQAVYIRELEQKNDDLERGQRVISESVSCIEAMLNQAYERNAVLESEVDEIENLRVRLQRATDEARDLKQELKVIERLPHHKKEDESENDNNLVNGHISNSFKVETETQTSVSSPLKREINGNAMTPSSRVTAINIVGDLLRKVGLERFLCRECGKVKCSCGTTADDAPQGEDVNMNSDSATASDNNDNNSVEFRNVKLNRRLSGENSLQSKPPASTQFSKRSSEQPFTRYTGSEPGKLRRSFAVRSREGLESILNFSIKRNSDQSKTKPTF